MMLLKHGQRFADSFFVYSTRREVAIRSKRVAVLYRLIQLSIICYIIGYIIIYKKGYQDTENAYGTTTTKVKGIAITDKNSESLVRVWDATDYVLAPMDTNGFFVMTNFIATYKQTQGLCPEFPDKGAKCNPNNNQCRNGSLSALKNGVMTGNCVLYESKNQSKDSSADKHSCEIHAWCPVENDTLTHAFIRTRTPLLEEAENFTVFIKNYVSFPKFGIRKRNFPESIWWDSYIQNCTYDITTHQYCPIFRLGDIVKLAGGNFSQMAYQGSAVRILIQWICDLDRGVDACRPRYQFYRFDPDEDRRNISKGLNFRFAKTYRIDGKEYRDLYKAFGILFLVNIVGSAGRFNFIELSLKIGSGIALLALATVLCNIFVFYCHRKRKYYEQHRLHRVDNRMQESVTKTDAAVSTDANADAPSLYKYRL